MAAAVLVAGRTLVLAQCEDGVLLHDGCDVAVVFLDHEGGVRGARVAGRRDAGGYALYLVIRLVLRFLRRWLLLISGASVPASATAPSIVHVWLLAVRGLLAPLEHGGRVTLGYWAVAALQLLVVDLSELGQAYLLRRVLEGALLVAEASKPFALLKRCG